MAKGTNKVEYLGTNVTGQKHGMWDFIYTTSTTKSSLYNVGDRVVLPDGREFRYAKSDGVCNAGRAVEFTAIGYITSGYLTVTQSIGDRQITVPAGSHAVLAADALRNGYVIIYNPPTTASETCMFRGIVGNDAADDGAAFTVYLDGPLTAAVTTSDTCEIFQNPYAAVHTGTVANFPKGGVPAVYVSATGYYLWVQVKGPVWIFPATAQVGAAGGLGCMWSNDGGFLRGVAESLQDTILSGCSSQYAGYVLEGSQPNIGPLFNLQG